MKILFYSPFILRVHHFATEMELALKHLSEKDEVHFLLCDTSLRTCQKNVSHTANSCTECILKRDNYLSWLNIPYKNRHYLNLDRYQKDIKIPKFENISEIKEFKIDDVDIGFASASSLISDTKETYPDLNEYEDLVNRSLITGVSLYQAGLDILKEISPDIIYLFNGRYVVVRPIFRAAQKLNIKTLIYENPGMANQYCIWEDTLPHDLFYVKNKIESVWKENKNKAEKEKKAHQWFNRNQIRDKNLSDRFMFYQKKDSLPKDINKHKNKRIISIFVSSEYEFAAIDKVWLERFYINQNEVIEKLINKVTDENIQFYIRVHPNLKGHNNTQTKFLNKFKAKNLTIIKPDEDIDSYSLLKVSEKIITFRSTIGLEATYWGKPSICIGRSYYEDLNVSYNVKDYESLYELVLQKNLPPLPKEGTLKYAYWFNNLGIDYKFYKPQIKEGIINVDSTILINNQEITLDLVHEKNLINIKTNLPSIVNNFYKKNLINEKIDHKYKFTFLVKNYKNNIEAIKSLLEQKYKKIDIVIFASYFDLEEIKQKFSKFVNFQKRIKIVFYKDSYLENISEVINSLDEGYFSWLENVGYYFKDSIENLFYKIYKLKYKPLCISTDYILWDNKNGVYEFENNKDENGKYKENILSIFLIEKRLLLKVISENRLKNIVSFISNNYECQDIHDPLFLKV